MNSIIENTALWVKKQLENEGTGHDWYHIYRVTKMAKNIAIEENADIFIVLMAALLHDLADDKIVENEKEGIKNIISYLENQGIEQEKISHIVNIIQTISFKGGKGEELHSLEARVVQDADRLDAIGAIGIARTFQYGGARNRPIYDHRLPVRQDMSLEEYRNGKSSSIHHFFEKLLLLKDMMNTNTAKTIAKRRHDILVHYLNEFFDEWGVPDEEI